jgi:hypothetical protein
MSKYVNEETARTAAVSGVMVGRTEPCRDTKGSCWQVYLNDWKLTACVVVDPWGISCGEEITETELPLYVDDEKEAIRLIRANMHGNGGQG